MVKVGICHNVLVLEALQYAFIRVVFYHPGVATVLYNSGLYPPYRICLWFIFCTYMFQIIE